MGAGRICARVLAAGMLAVLLACAMAVVSGLDPACAPAFAADTAGTVMVATPGAFVKRGGEQMPLKVKDTVQVGDTLVTDATGRVRVWMRDDTTISLGANSHFTLEAYSAAGSKPQLKGAMTGLARLLTGKIAKANPEGTVVNTPLASVGIRGTICTIEASREMTRVAVESCPTDVLVNGIPLISGQLGIVRQAGGAPQITPLPQDLRRELGGQVAANRTRPASASTPAAGTPGVRGLAPVTTSPLYAAKDVAPNVDQALAQKAEELFRPTPIPPGPTPGSVVLPINATVTVNLDPRPRGYAEYGQGRSGLNYVFDSTFIKNELSFNVSLGGGNNGRNGAVSHATLSGQGEDLSYGSRFAFELTGGSGKVDKGQFTLNSFTGKSANWCGHTYGVTGQRVEGKVSRNNTSVTGVNGTFRVRAADTPGGWGWFEVEGTFKK